MNQILQWVLEQPPGEILPKVILPLGIGVAVVLGLVYLVIGWLIPKPIVGLTAVLLAGALVSAIAYIFYLTARDLPERRSARFHDQFRMNDELGLCIHLGKPGYFCPRCKGQERETQLAVHGRGWRCPDKECGYSTIDPRRKPDKFVIDLPPRRG
jgi:hypothetical protein